MKKGDLRAKFLALRALADECLRDLDEVEDAPAMPEPTYMKLGEFCKRWGVSKSTLYSRIGEGLPVFGEERDRRVKVAEGDEWMQRRTGKRAA